LIFLNKVCYTVVSCGTSSTSICRVSLKITRKIQQRSRTIFFITQLTNYWNVLWWFFVIRNTSGYNNIKFTTHSHQKNYKFWVVLRSCFSMAIKYHTDILSQRIRFRHSITQPRLVNATRSQVFSVRCTATYKSDTLRHTVHNDNVVP